MGNTTNVTKEDLKPENVAVTEGVAVQASSEVKAEATTPAASPIKSVAVGEGPITFEQFQTVDVRVGEIKVVEPVPKASKLLKLGVDFGALGTRTVVAGIAKSFPDPQTLVGRRCAFVVNLPPRPMFEIESQAMLLAASSASEPEKVVLVEVAGATPGSRLG